LASTAALAVAVALIVGFTVSAWQATVATQAKNEAQANEKKAVAAEGRVKEALDRAEQDRASAIQSASELRKQVYVSDIGLAHRSVEDGDLGRAQALLGKHQPNPTEEDLRGIEWRHLWSRSQGNFEADLGPYVVLYSGLTISPDGQFVAVNRLHPTRVEVIHLASGSVAKSIVMQDTVSPLAYSPSGNFLIGEMRGKIIGWDTRNWKALETVALTSPFAFGYHGNQEILVALEGDHLSMWDVTAWQTLGALENKEPEAPLLDPSYGLSWHMKNSVAVSSDSEVAYLAGASKIRRWDLNQRTELPPLEIAGMASLATSSDGQLAGSDAIGNVLLIQPQSGEILHTFKSHHSWATCLKFTQDGTRLVSASEDRNLVIHDPINRSIVGRLLGHQKDIMALDISADGQTVVSGACRSRVLRWSLTELGNESFDLDGIKTSSVLEDGRILMLRDNANDLEYYDPVSSAVEPAHAERLVRAMRENQAEPIAFSPTAKWAVSIDGSKLAVWNVFTGELERSLEHPSGSIGDAIFSPDGNYLVTGSGDSKARLWQIPDWTSQPLGPKVLAFLDWAAFSRDKRRVAISGQDEKIKVYDFEQEPRKITLPSGAENLTTYSVALSNDGRWLASGSGGTIHVLDLESNIIAATLKGHMHGVFSLSFSPDDRTLVSSSGSRVIFWHVETWQELMRFQDNVPPRRVSIPRAEFSPDGRYLVRVGRPIGETGTRFRIWQAPSLEEIAEKHKR
jgi:WD40 repeat protein